MMLEFLTEHLLPIACEIAVGILLIYGFWRYIKAPEMPDSVIPARLPWRKLLPRVLLWTIATRLFLYLAAYAIGHFIHPESVSQYGIGHWVRWDANHYLRLAQNWYVNEGDPRNHIVFYPLYPLLVMGLDQLLHHTLLSALIISNLCLVGCGYLLFRLVEQRQGIESASRALKYLMLCPVSLFFSVPYSESLFLLMSLLAVYLARNRKIHWAVLFGALASSARMLGLLTAVPIFYECIQMARERAAGDRGMFIRQLIKWFCVCCLVACGFGAYLLLNKTITGDPFTFLTIQSEHWSQTFGSLRNTLRYSFDNAIDNDSLHSQLGIWIPQLVAIFSMLALLIATRKRSHPGDSAFAILYFYVALAPTWLLSGPRYLGAMYALYPLLTLITRRRWQDITLTILFILGSAYCGYAYAVMGSML
ncbi:hypothetical protein LJC33_08960 [Eubacteriales bacterium OttesenSCG-928-N13]|nr:hypothetical protein [Eubacteriales bacterium OttesenSCG-928-N13]